MKYVEQVHNVYSQSGEDGVIHAILKSFPILDNWCVEFGAWDGIYLSNTRLLIEESNYSAILIEPNPSSYRRLVSNCGKFPNVTCMMEFVGFDSADSLDTLLSPTKCPKDFDLLSIDIDGNDIHVWRAITHYRPKLVCIEFNATIPDGVVFEQPADPKIKWGCSLDALKILALEKGYILACVHKWNAFFVSEEVWSQIPDAERMSSQAPSDPRVPITLFVGYDGTLLTSSDISLDWHGLTVDMRHIQPLPKILRRYPLDYNWFQRGLFKMWSSFVRK
jgi:hypothetical protein